MKTPKTALLLSFALLCLSCTQVGRSSAYFQPAGSSSDADSRITSLARQFGYLQSKLGFAIYEFEFRTPPDKNLTATFKAELDGQLVPGLSGIYHIPPTGNERGWITIRFLNPQYQTQTPQSPTWELDISSGAKGSNWTMVSPFVLTANEASGTEVGIIGLGMFEDDQEHQVWKYGLSPVTTKNSKQSEFKYTLDIKLEEGKSLNKIEKEAFK